MGMAHYGLGEYADAVPYLKTAVSRDAQNLQLLLALAHSCLWSKQYQCVLDTYHEILMLNAESAEADMLAGEAGRRKAVPAAPSCSFGGSQGRSQGAGRSLRPRLPAVGPQAISLKPPPNFRPRLPTTQIKPRRWPASPIPTCK